MGDGARCLAAAECSGVTVPLTGHDMKDEAWSVSRGVEGWRERNPTTGSLQNPPADGEREKEGGGKQKKRENSPKSFFLLSESAPLS